jgi:hypothetical protein
MVVAGLVAFCGADHRKSGYRRGALPKRSDRRAFHIALLCYFATSAVFNRYDPLPGIYGKLTQARET